MSDPATGPTLEIRAAPSRAREWVTSVVLITFTSLVGIGCVIALSSTLTQTRMSSIAIDGVPLSIWKLDDIRGQWADVRDVIRLLSEGITAGERDRVKQTEIAATTEREFASKQRNLIVKLGEIIYRLQIQDPELAKQLLETADPARRYARLVVARQQLIEAHSDLKGRFDELDATYAEYGKARDEN